MTPYHISTSVVVAKNSRFLTLVGLIGSHSLGHLVSTPNVRHPVVPVVCVFPLKGTSLSLFEVLGNNKLFPYLVLRHAGYNHEHFYARAWMYEHQRDWSPRVHTRTGISQRFWESP